MAKNELNSLAVSAFCESMAMMLEAGIQPDEAAALLAEDSGAGQLQQAARSMQKSLLLGESLSQAAKTCGMFPDYAVRMIAAGEVSGRTDSVLRSLARHYASQDQLQKKLKSAVFYPGVLLGLTAVILAVLVAKVLPVFTGVYQSLAGSLAGSSYGYIRFAYVVGWAALAVTLLLAAALAAGLILSRSASGAHRLARMFEVVPFTASAARKLAVARLASALSLFLASGVDADTALTAASDMVEHQGLRAQLQACHEEMQKGKGLSTALFEQKVFEPLYGRMLISGARSGQTDTVLARLSQLFTQDAQAAMDALIDSIEPILAAFLTLAVGVTLLAVMLPLIGILGSIG